MDDDDAFLYGEPSFQAEAPKADLATNSVVQAISFETVKTVSNGVVKDLEAKAEEEEPPFGLGADESETGDDNAAGEEESSDEDDIEIIMDQPIRSIDNRPNVPPRAPALNRSTGGPQSTPNRPPPTHSQLTTEYTPRDRNVPPSKAPAPPVHSGGTPQTPSVPRESVSVAPEQPVFHEGLDPSTLPPTIAPPSHPSINPDIPGILDGHSILEVDISAMAEKQWRLPGADISDWFNYGFDEISWEAYCYRRRDLGELANVLKTNVLNFAAMPEDQLIALPPELRTMVMTGANAMMNTASQGMMGPSVGMNPMMEMPGMGPMNMGPMGMGMNGDMGMQMQPGGPLMPDGPIPGQVPVGQNGTPEQGVQMGIQDGFGPGMMGMGGDFGMQMNVFVFLSRSKDRWDSLCIPAWRGVQHRHQSLCRRQCLRQLLQRLRTWAVGHPQHNSEVVQWLKAYAEEAALLDGDEDMAELQQDLSVQLRRYRPACQPVPATRTGIKTEITTRLQLKVLTMEAR
jgi:pre-mRNA 3'-end-processing factor FIP1